jgi:D-glycero-beta-D-manno-heptose 1-phosphate adenylyltransferase
MGLIVRDHEELARRLRGLRDAGKRVVFTNGCFDLLHVGHIRCLVDAAKRGDYLVVALNSDASTRKLKGPERPVQSEEERVELLCALQCVAYVTIFDEATCGPLLRLLRPQLVAKGTDYTLETLPERDVLAEIGAELIRAGDPKDHSTVDLIERIKQGLGAGTRGPKAAKKPVATKSAKAPATKAAPPKPASKKAFAKPAIKLPPKGAAKAAAASAASISAKKRTRSATETHG